MYAVINMGYTPSQWINLSQKDRAFIMACISLKLDEEKRAKAKAKKSSKPKLRRK